MHLLRGPEGIQGAGEEAETIQYKYECRQGPCTCADHRDDTDDSAREQADMSVDKVLALAQTIVTIQMTLPGSKQVISRTMLMKRHQRIAPLFSDDFWGTH